MPQISPAEYQALPLRVHEFLSDVPLHDAWAVDLPGRQNHVDLAEFLQRSGGRGIHKLGLAPRALFALRFLLGRIFRLETEPVGAQTASFGNRLTAEDRSHSLVEPGTPQGLFRVLYRFENEQLLEIQNRTVHAAALSALFEKGAGYRFYFAVYVRQTSWLTPLYMRVIDPFRKWIIYPAMLNAVRAAWDRVISPNGAPLLSVVREEKQAG